MSEPRQTLVLATATWTQLHGLTQAYQAAVMRGDDADAARLRDECHDMLDNALDLYGEAAGAVRDLLTR